MQDVICSACGATNKLGERKFRRWKEGKAKVNCNNCGNKLLA